MQKDISLKIKGTFVCVKLACIKQENVLISYGFLFS